MYKAIALGTKNQTKVQAVESVLKEYEDLFPQSEIIPFSVESDVPEQPIGFDQIIEGAKNRAKHAYQEAHADLSVGIEDGIAKMPHTRTGYMNFCCCAIFDGHDFVIGMSGGFEYPKEVIRQVLEEKKNITDSFYDVGLTKNRNIGSAEGAIGVMTKGRENRVDGTKAALRRALIQMEHKDLF